MTLLDHKMTVDRELPRLAEEIDALADRLDQTHPLERKVRFLLDVRGYLKVNAIRGSYVEFGSFRSEMQYAAWSILDQTGRIHDYVGLDTFSGEPPLANDDAGGSGHNAVGDFACDYQEVARFVERTIGPRGHLIRGDFRKAPIITQCDPFAPFNLAVIDCNLPSSITAALNYVLPRLRPGGVLLLDDYFADVTGGRLRTAGLFGKALRQADRFAVSHGFYPPFARSFVIVDHPPADRTERSEP